MFGVMELTAIPNHTLDSKDSKDKVLRTRKIKQYEFINMYSYFCSNQCYNDFANANIEQIIAIAPRREPLETPIDRVEKIKHENDYHSWTETRDNT
jgi:hypothetical protein